MTIPKTVDEFLVEVTRQTVRETVSVQDTLRFCLDRSADTPRTYLAVWDAVQQAGLLATFDFQNVMLQAAQTLIDAGLRPVPQPHGKPASPTPSWSARLVKLPPVEAPQSDSRYWVAMPTEEDISCADQWAASALQFLPPPGIIAAGYPDTLDEEAED